MNLRLIHVGVYGVNGQMSNCSQGWSNNTHTCISNSVDFKSLDLRFVMPFSTNPTEAACSKKTEFISLLKCMNDARLKCFDDNVKTIFPTNQMEEKALNYMCTRIDSYNTDCLKKALVNINPCVFKGLEIYSNSTLDDPMMMMAYICGAQKNIKKCTEDSNKFTECPETKTTYLELIKIQNPEACGGEAGFESGFFNKSNDQAENVAPPLYQSLTLLITISLMKFIF